MSTNTEHYVIVGVDVGYHWDKRPDDDEDAWFDRHDDDRFGYYAKKKPGEYGILKDSMSTRYCIVGKLVARCNEEETLGAMAFGEQEIAALIADASPVLVAKFGITEPAKLHIITHVT